MGRRPQSSLSFSELLPTLGLSVIRFWGLQVPYGPERTKIDMRIQQIAGERVPWIFLVNPGWREAFKKEWTGFHWYPDNNVHFDWLYKK